MIILFKGVLVVKIWKWNKTQIELCIFPPNKLVESHKHDDEDIELCHIWGCAHYVRCSDDLDIREHRANFRDMGRFFTIPRGYWHSAKVGAWGLITLSCQRWTTEPSSVTQDYIELSQS